MGNVARSTKSFMALDSLGFISESVHGDMLTTSLDSFADANILVAGPPCPPFSSCGKRLALEDCRAKPFERCVDVLAKLDSRAGRAAGSNRGPRDQLMFFLLENVMGISFLPKHSDALRKPLDILMHELRARLGDAWQGQYVQANSLDYGLPQNRPRIYIVGSMAKFYTPHIPSSPSRFRNQVRPG